MQAERDGYREQILAISKLLREHGITGFLIEHPESAVRYVLGHRARMRDVIEQWTRVKRDESTPQNLYFWEELQRLNRKQGPMS